MFVNKEHQSQRLAPGCYDSPDQFHSELEKRPMTGTPGCGQLRFLHGVSVNRAGTMRQSTSSEFRATGMQA